MRIKREQSMYQLICSDNVNTLLQKRGGEWGKYMQKFLIGLSDQNCYISITFRRLLFV